MAQLKKKKKEEEKHPIPVRYNAQWRPADVSLSFIVYVSCFGC